MARDCHDLVLGRAKLGEPSSGSFSKSVRGAVLESGFVAPLANAIAERV